MLIKVKKVQCGKITASVVSKHHYKDFESKSIFLSDQSLMRCAKEYARELMKDQVFAESGYDVVEVGSDKYYCYFLITYNFLNENITIRK